MEGFKCMHAYSGVCGGNGAYKAIGREEKYNCWSKGRCCLCMEEVACKSCDAVGG